MSSNLNKKSNEQKPYNFIYSPISINTNKIINQKEASENQKSNDQITKYHQNISSQNKNHINNLNSKSSKDKLKVTASPNNHFFYKNKMLKENNINQSKNFNETKNSEQNNRSPISLTGRITNIHNIKLNKEKNDKDEKKSKINSNINTNENRLIKSSNIVSHNSKSVNNNTKNKNLKYGNNLIIKIGNINEGLNNLRKENIYANTKKNNYNFNNNNLGIIDNMNNNTSKNKKKNENSNNSNLNLGMLSFSTSNISVNNLMPVNNHNSSNLNNNNGSHNNFNNINIIKNSNILEEQGDKNNNITDKDFISNTASNTNKNAKLITNADDGKKNNNKNNQTKSAEQTTRNPKYFKNESIYNTNYIINFIESNDVKNGKLSTNNKLEGSNKIYAIGQKDSKNNNSNNNAYKLLTDITKNNINEILSKKNCENKKSSENINKKGNNYNLEFNNGKKYKNPEELHFSMVKISQNINNLKYKF